MINFLYKLPFTFYILLTYYLKLSDLVVLSGLSSVFRGIVPLRKKAKERYNLFNDVIDHEFWLRCLSQNANYLDGPLKNSSTMNF